MMINNETIRVTVINTKIIAIILHMGLHDTLNVVGHSELNNVARLQTTYWFQNIDQSRNATAI